MRAVEFFVVLVGLAVLAGRGCEVCRSEAGLWAEYPHSGFCPECRESHVE